MIKANNPFICFNQLGFKRAEINQKEREKKVEMPQVKTQFTLGVETGDTDAEVTVGTSIIEEGMLAILLAVCCTHEPTDRKRVSQWHITLERTPRTQQAMLF